MIANRLALITGAGNGIGRAIAETFIKQGANLALVDVADNLDSVKNQLNKANPNLKVSTHKCDISDSEQVKALFNNVQREFPDHQVPTIIVNSAGITQDSLMVKMSEEKFDEVIKVNLKGSFLVTQTAFNALINHFPKFNEANPDKPYASIIHFSSVVSRYGNVGQTNYCASKAGVEGLVRSSLFEMGRYRIRCNAILPGFIKTAMTDKVPPKIMNLMIQQISLGRMGLPQDIANLALFLGSDLSSYMTGSSIDINGGLIL